MPQSIIRRAVYGFLLLLCLCCQKRIDSANADPAVLTAPTAPIELLEKADEALKFYAKIISSMEIGGITVDEVRQQLNDADSRLEDVTMDFAARDLAPDIGNVKLSDERTYLATRFKEWLKMSVPPPPNFVDTRQIIHVRWVPDVPVQGFGKDGTLLNNMHGGEWGKNEWTMAEALDMLKSVPDITVLVRDKTRAGYWIPISEKLDKMLRSYELSGEEPKKFFGTFSPVTTRELFPGNFSKDSYPDGAYKGKDYYDLDLYVRYEEAKQKIYEVIKVRVDSTRVQIKKAKVKQDQAATLVK